MRLWPPRRLPPFRPCALQARNSEAIIRRDEVKMLSTQEVDAFWRITPSGTSLPHLGKHEGRFVPAVE